MEETKFFVWFFVCLLLSPSIKVPFIWSDISLYENRTFTCCVYRQRRLTRGTGTNVTGTIYLHPRDLNSGSRTLMKLVYFTSSPSKSSFSLLRRFRLPPINTLESCELNLWTFSRTVPRSWGSSLNYKSLSTVEVTVNRNIPYGLTRNRRSWNLSLPGRTSKVNKPF